MLNQDFNEFIQFLNDNQVSYLVVGGYAVAVHGYPRYTKDIDIWVQRTPENAAAILRALDQFGFGRLDLSANDFLEVDRIIQLGIPPRRIDLLTSVPGLEFDDCYPTRVSLDMNGLRVDFIDLENLKKNKQASGRLQDLADLENLT